MSDLADGDLASLALAGQQAAFSALMKRHSAAVFRIARHHCGDGALDITQQTFIAAFAALSRYDRARPFAPWLARIALNKCHDWARRRKVRRLFSLSLPEQPIAIDPALPADTALADQQELARTMAAIAALPARLKEVLVLCAIEGMPHSEVGAVLGITAKAVETRLYRAREKLREALRD